MTYVTCVAFLTTLYTKTDSAAQNAHLMRYITPYTPQRKRTRKEDVNRAERVNSQYSIRKEDGSLVIICATAFRNIVGIGKNENER